LIAAARGTDEVAAAAFEVLDNPERAFVTSDFIRLEVLPKAAYYNNHAELEFYEAFFHDVERTVHASKPLVSRAHEEARKAGLAAMDALHVAAAKIGKSAELITTEKPSKPLFRAAEIVIKTIRS
jgi:hypothetical protein